MSRALLFFLLSSWLPLSHVGLAQDPEPRPPNIVFIMVDDLGWADLGCYGQKTVATPRIDRLAQQGMRFTQAYSGSTVCAPARSVLMTGYHAGHTIMRRNTGGVPIPDETVTVAEVLKKAGYVTGGFGKWGLGDLDTTGAPEKQGFDTFFGYYHQIHAHEHYPEYLIRNGEKVTLEGNAGFYAERRKEGFVATRDADEGAPREFAPELILAAMKTFLRENRERPFFCYAPWTPPHGRYEMPLEDPAAQKYANRKGWAMRDQVIAAMNAMVDRHVGEILDLLDELGLANDTIVFFCSDHGAAYRLNKTLQSSGPLRGRKRAMFEGGLRVPMIVRWPGHISEGAASDHVWTFADVMATLADLTGAAEHIPADTDGLSIVPTLRGREDEQELHDYFYWEWHLYDWGRKADVHNGLMQAVRLGDWKILRHRGSEPWQLYDLAEDPGETTDLAAQNTDLVEELGAIAEEAHVQPPSIPEPRKPRGRSYR